MSKEPSDTSDVAYYMAELDSVRLKDNFDFGEARFMAQLLRGTVILTLPQLVDTPLRHLVNNIGFAKLLKEGRIAVSLYQEFYSLVEYAAIQMEGSFWWSSLSHNFNTSNQYRQLSGQVTNIDGYWKILQVGGVDISFDELLEIRDSFNNVNN